MDSNNMNKQTIEMKLTGKKIEKKNLSRNSKKNLKKNNTIERKNTLNFNKMCFCLFFKLRDEKKQIQYDVQITEVSYSNGEYVIRIIERTFSTQISIEFETSKIVNPIHLKKTANKIVNTTKYVESSN